MAEPCLDLDAIYDVLVAEAGARDGRLERDEFKMHWPDCCEFRFMGSLGFGGKVWAPKLHFDLATRARSWRPPYVTCYPEDQTPERLATIERTNRVLAALVDVAAGDSDRRPAT